MRLLGDYNKIGSKYFVGKIDIVNNWNILLENADDGSTIATILEVPNLQISNNTKQGAFEKV